MTVNVRPAIVTVPVRDDVDVFAATVMVALPSPVPDAPAATVSQLAPLVDVQAQPLPAVTATAIDSPAAGEVRAAGLMV